MGEEEAKTALRDLVYPEFVYEFDVDACQASGIYTEPRRYGRSQLQVDPFRSLISLTQATGSPNFTVTPSLYTVKTDYALLTFLCACKHEVSGSSCHIEPGGL